ncbi:MAG TPA: Arc family DNA-binding protein [Thermoanaerobaculia bacterium]
MATLTLKNVPHELVERLKDEAKQNRRSLNQETLARLELSLAKRRRSGDETVAALRKLHKKMRGLPLLTDEFLERAKNEGRP